MTPCLLCRREPAPLAHLVLTDGIEPLFLCSACETRWRVKYSLTVVRPDPPTRRRVASSSTTPLGTAATQ